MKHHVLAIKGPCFGHFQERGLQDTTSNVKFGMKHALEHCLGFRKNQFEGPCEGPVQAIKEPYFGHFQERGLENTTSNLKFDIEEKSERQCEDHVWVGLYRVILWPFLGKGVRGCIQQCEIWQGAALDTTIKIQEDSI